MAWMGAEIMSVGVPKLAGARPIASKTGAQATAVSNRPREGLRPATENPALSLV